MSPFVIVGTGGLGRELLGWIAGSGAEHHTRFRPAAFISEGDDAGGLCHGVPVLHPDKWSGQAPRFIVAVADPAIKRRLAVQLAQQGWIPETYIHESSVVGLSTAIGAGSVICPFCRISSDAKLGDHVLVNGGSGVGHDAVVGSYSSLLGSVSVNGNVIVGEGVTIGAGSLIYPGKRVGDGAMIGMGSVVIRNVRERTTVFGNPAKRID